MGGLVIKRAYIMANQIKELQSIAQRVRVIVFLATPHRGADLAQLLTKVLNISPGARPFVKDLHRNSLATQSINDEFPQYSQDLRLYSFYETLPITYGLGKRLVVEKDMAVLGYANEFATYLNANHREICKYATTDDSNYKTVRNVLASTMNRLRETAIPSKPDINSEQQRLLDGSLGFTDAHEDYFMDIDDLRLTGSCEWLIKKRSFQEWRDSTNTQLYWISAKPGTGKTVLSGKVIHHLKSFDRDIAFYFFDYRNKTQTTISSFLLSMARQMAHMHLEVMQIVLEICQNDDQLRKADYRTIWRKLFVEGILRIKFSRSQYWVIDALDECKSDSNLIPLLLKMVETNSRILLTSRDRFESHRQSLYSKARVISEEILADDTKLDIALYLKANMHQLPAIDEEARQNMISTISAKSAGCFLWVSLILQELRRAHTLSEIRQVLDEVPSDMNHLYSRILDQMSRAPAYGKVLAKAILTWTVCASRPLTTDELYDALQLDIKDKIDSVVASVESRCGQLVYIDAQSRVQIIHQTARDYLLQSSDTSEFGVDRKIGHGRLLITCLEYLNGNEMRGYKNRKLSADNVRVERGPFASYACNSFFDHIFHVSSQNDEILIALGRFLGSFNVLAWIEYTARDSDLNHLIKAASAFKNFLRRRSKYLSPFGKDTALLDSWATDLIRLVAKFGKNMKASPSSIYHLIPPFCPAETAPRKYFAAPTRGISVIGLSAIVWDDCLSTIVDPQEQFSALASSDKYFAVGTSSGKIVVYNETTCQEARTLQHQESVTLLNFGQKIDSLVSAGSQSIRLWDTSSWELLWESKTSQQCMSVAFVEANQILLGALRNNQLMIWDLSTGIVRDTTNWTEEHEGPRSHSFRRPTVAAFCIESCLLAVVYRGKDILLWDLERDALHDTYNRNGSSSRTISQGDDAGVLCLVFSVAPNATLLAAGYADGDLLLFDTAEGIVKETALANAQTLACSPDGRTLASGDSSGTIQLFDFETLRPLYRINSDEYCIRNLVFSGDSHRLIDIRRSECRVWDPMVLVRQDNDEENSDTVSISTGPQEISTESPKNVILITSLACHRDGEIFFCGKENGSVYLYETKYGRQSHKLFDHAHGVSIVSLFFDNESNTLVSLDMTSRVIAHKLVHQQHGWEATEVLFDHHGGAGGTAGAPRAAVQQVLTNPGSTRMLISTRGSDSLWSIPLDDNTVIATTIWENRGSYRWGTHPLNQDQLILISDNVVHLYEWQTLQRITEAEGILLEGSILPELAIRSITPCFDNTVIATAFSESPRPQSRFKLILWNASDFRPELKIAAPLPKCHTLADQVKSLIGDYGKRLVFLNTNSWISSAEARVANVDGYARHFFVPADWLTTNVKLMTEVTRNGDIIFVKRDEVAVIKRGLENIEQEVSNAPGKRPSLLGGKRP